ncbi:hypothetical protein ACTVCO_02870 [Sanguibacter sp. A247]|uniref:hypothetical protein n=1 Tax=unclassified Sanguibacter TaxID=2645534 RepID=UPI003FD8D470
MKSLRTVLVAGACAAALAGCTGGGDPDPTAAPPTPPPATTSAPTTPSAEPTTFEPTIDASQWCAAGDADEGDLEASFGKISAANDEWADAMDRTWRHYIPVTLTNTMDVPCTFGVWLDAAVEGAATGNEDLTVPLLPGQSYTFQAFDLEEFVKFSGDTKDATTKAKVTPSINLVTRSAYLDYYDLATEVGDVSGEGAKAVLPVSITLNGVQGGMPDRKGVSKDMVHVLGLDSDGAVITKASARIDPLDQGETRQLELPVGGGTAGDVRNQVPVSVYDDVTSWTVVMQPAKTDLDPR